MAATPTLDWAPAATGRWLCPECGHGADQPGPCPRDGRRLLPVDSDEALVGTVVDGRFAIDALIGVGGMGAVYRATQTSVGRPVALKVVRRSRAGDAGTVRRFFREARAVSRLNHPNCVVLHDFGQTPTGLLYMAMELVPGKSLAQLITEQGRLPVERVVRIGAQICDGLSEAHRLGLLHRDLKPENVMVLERSGQSDVVKVLDFGIAKAMDQDEAPPGALPSPGTASGVIAGTPAYMSPEAAQALPLDARSDLYSLGVVFFEMLTGRRPFEAAEAVATLLLHVTAPVPELGVPGVPPELDALVRSLLAKAPRDRPESATVLRDRLERTLQPPRAVTPAPNPATTADVPVPARRTRAVAVTAVGAALLAVGVWAWPRAEAPSSTSPKEAVVVPAAPATKEATIAAPAAFIPLREPESATALATRRGLDDVPVPVAPAAPTTRVIRVDSTPTGAVVEDGDMVLGTAPQDVTLTVGTPRRLELKRKGYSTARVTLDDVSPAELVVPLERRPERGLKPL
jgi:hypothetical protein